LTRDGFDESNTYICIDRRDACPTVLYRLLRAYAIRPYLSHVTHYLLLLLITYHCFSIRSTLNAIRSSSSLYTKYHILYTDFLSLLHRLGSDGNFFRSSLFKQIHYSNYLTMEYIFICL